MAYQSLWQFYGVVPIDKSVSWIPIEKHDTAGIEDAGTIEITMGVNGTLVFRHMLAVSMAFKTYTIVFAGGSFTTEELLVEMNAAVVTQGSIANGITTTVAFINDRFVIRCTAGSVVFGIQILGSAASAAESLGLGKLRQRVCSVMRRRRRLMVVT